MEGLKKHKIKHISASNINTFITNPAEWVIHYIYKLSFLQWMHFNMSNMHYYETYD